MPSQQHDEAKGRDDANSPSGAARLSSSGAATAEAAAGTSGHGAKKAPAAAAPGVGEPAAGRASSAPSPALRHPQHQMRAHTMMPVHKAPPSTPARARHYHHQHYYQHYHPNHASPYYYPLVSSTVPPSPHPARRYPSNPLQYDGGGQSLELGANGYHGIESKVDYEDEEDEQRDARPDSAAVVDSTLSHRRYSGMDAPATSLSSFAHHSTAAASLLKTSPGCTCKKSMCLKMYCQCFASSTTCGSKCRCESCHNTPTHAAQIEDARRLIMNRNPAAFNANAKLVVVVGGPTISARSSLPCSASDAARPTSAADAAAPAPPMVAHLPPPAAFRGRFHSPPGQRRDSGTESGSAPAPTPHPFSEQVVLDRDAASSQYSLVSPYSTRRAPHSVTPGVPPATTAGRTAYSSPPATAFSTKGGTTVRASRYECPSPQLPRGGREGALTMNRRHSALVPASETTGSHILYGYSSLADPTLSPARRINRRHCKCRRSKCLKNYPDQDFLTTNFRPHGSPSFAVLASDGTHEESSGLERMMRRTTMDPQFPPSFYHHFPPRRETLLGGQYPPLQQQLETRHTRPPPYPSATVANTRRGAPHEHGSHPPSLHQDHSLIPQGSGELRMRSGSNDEPPRVNRCNDSKAVEASHHEEKVGAGARDDGDNHAVEEAMECETSEAMKVDTEVYARDAVGCQQHPSPSESRPDGTEKDPHPADKAVPELQPCAMDVDPGDEDTSADRTQRGPPQVEAEFRRSLTESGRGDYDRMAVMAAVAMTELLSGLGRDSDKPASEREEKPAAAGHVPPLTTPLRHRRVDSNHSTYDPKRRQECHHPRGTDDGGIYVSKRRKSASLGDDEVRAVVPSASYMSVESRNPSPIDKGSVQPVPPTYQFCGAYEFAPPHLESPSALHYNSLPQQRSPHHSSRLFSSGGPSFHPGHIPSSLAPHVGYPTLRPPSVRVHEHHPYRPHGYHYPSPASLDYFRGREASVHLNTPPRSSQYERLAASSSLIGNSASSYCEDVLRVSSGLPKPLSYRKICSKCGKTRSEHAESSGFGNKCNFRDCGKCGASLDRHVAAGCPMGVHCLLSVEQGARPGSADSYRRKLHELAARADLQRELRDADRRSPVSVSSSSPASAQQQQTPATIAGRDP